MNFAHVVSESKENRLTRVRHANNFCCREKAAWNSAQDENTGVPHWYHDANRAGMMTPIVA
jgi:hypothetical protein